MINYTYMHVIVTCLKRARNRINIVVIYCFWNYMSCVALIFFLFVIVMFFSRIAMPRNNTSHCLFNCSIVFLSLLSTSFLFFATPAYRLAICLKILYCNMSALEVEIDQRCTSFNNLWCLQGSGKYPEPRKLYHLPGAGMHLLLCVTSLEEI